MLRSDIKMLRLCSRIRLQNLFYFRKPFKRCIINRQCEFLRHIIYFMCFELSSSQQPVIQISESDSLSQFRLDERLKTAENGIAYNLKTLHFRTGKTNEFLLLQKQLKCPELYHLAFNVSKKETTTKQKQKYFIKIYYYCYHCWTKKTVPISLIFLSCKISLSFEYVRSKATALLEGHSCNTVTLPDS